jgi:hypothetical protein
LDVHYNSRCVITKPVLFVRLDELFDEKKRYRPKDAVYKKVQSVFIAFEPSRMEMTVSRAPAEAAAADVIAELKKLQQSASTTATAKK